jgi:polysaccharide export outer membrane protein
MTWRNIILHGNDTLRSVALRRSAVAFLCLFTLQACEDALPGIGPRPDTFGKAQWQYVADTSSDENADKLSFVLVDVDRKVTDYLATAEDKTYFIGTFTDRAPATDVLLGVGDTIRITIFEAGPGGLFVPAGGTANGGNYITLPDQEVDKTGRISIPYADKDGDGGLVAVHGRRPAEVQRDIEKRLLNKAIEPQVIVTLVKRTSNLYSVIGDVNGPGRFSVDQGGVRILDALGAAGGPKNNDYNTFITLQRGTTSATARLSTLLTKPENNIFVQPNDLIAVKKDERYYNVLGATTNNNRIAFEAETVSVADALAKAGGLNPEVAEPKAVVVFRREDPKALEAMGVKLEGNTSTDAVPTVYRFNLNDPAGMFLAQKMQLRNNDVVYVSNHSFSDASKVLGALRDVLLIQLIGK